MGIALLAVGLVVGGVLGVLVGMLLGRQRSQTALAESRAEVARLGATLAAHAEAGDGRMAAAILAATRQVSDDLAQRAAAEAAERRTTDEQLRQAQQETLDAMVGPVKEGLATLNAVISKVDGERRNSESTLLERLNQMAQATSGLDGRTAELTTALKGGVTRGKWGEFQLERVVELAGLAEHVTYQKQSHHVGPDARLRPDLLIHLPKGRIIVVDAKAVEMPVGVDQTDDAQRAADVQFSDRVRKRIRDLGSKDYVRGIDGAVGQVMMFMPSEAAYAGALRADPDLLAFAMGHNVMVVAPTTFLNALTAVELVWREHETVEHSGEALKFAGELHDRLMTFATRLTNVGTSLGKAMTAYNDAIGSFERRLIPAARKLEGARLNGGGEMVEVAPQEIAIRQVTSAGPGETDDADAGNHLDPPASTEPIGG
jgi:DNA recombination protein RmuC